MGELSVYCVDRSSLALLYIGLGLIAISVLGENPGYGVLSLYVIYSMTLSHTMFFLRVVLMLTLVGCHVSAIMIWNQVSMLV